ncbi:hypothetical protein SADUNF_Sadunf11G0066300 [Salix dunnii]|uniref:Uncharacterized protein n=1 Tax=Salix dunnii TaxID=1413687 RepID=A0A835JP04_9ROSI|nr:hypothetical protein SADUNF_Sadunf11G0066300 [Salix dunnii]
MELIGALIAIVEVREGLVTTIVWGLWKEDRALEIVDSSLQVLYHPQEALKCIKIGLLWVQEDVLLCRGQCVATNSATTSENQGIDSDEIKTEMKEKKMDNT